MKYKNILTILFLSYASFCLVNENLVVKAENENVYFEDFENIDLLSSITTYSNASLTKYNDSKVMSYITNEKYGIKLLKDTNLNSYYCLTLNYSHTQTTSEYMYISITSDKYSYAGITLKVQDDEVIECISGTSNNYDVKNYEVFKNGDMNVAKIFFWTGYEGDWHIKFGATSSAITCYVDNLHLALNGNGDDSLYYPQSYGIMFEDAEAINEFDKKLVDGNYTLDYIADGRITTDLDKVISGTTSYYASSDTVLEWQPFIKTIPSKIRLEEKEIYTVSFDYKIDGNN